MTGEDTGSWASLDQAGGRAELREQLVLVQRDLLEDWLVTDIFLRLGWHAAGVYPAHAPRLFRDNWAEVGVELREVAQAQVLLVGTRVVQEIDAHKPTRHGRRGQPGAWVVALEHHLVSFQLGRMQQALLQDGGNSGIEATVDEGQVEKLAGLEGGQDSNEDLIWVDQLVWVSLHDGRFTTGRTGCLPRWVTSLSGSRAQT